MATIMYEMSTTLANTAAIPPANDEFPVKKLAKSGQLAYMGGICGQHRTVEDCVDGRKVRADRDDNHGS